RREVLAAGAALEHPVATEKIDEVTLQAVGGPPSGVAETRHDVAQPPVDVFALREHRRVALGETLPDWKAVADPERSGVGWAQAGERRFLHHVDRERRTGPATRDAEAPGNERVDAVAGNHQRRRERTPVARAQVDGLARLLGTDHV